MLSSRLLLCSFLATLVACGGAPPSTQDGGLGDSGVSTDAGDAGGDPPDAGEPDAGPLDAGDVDAGAPDSGEVDAGFFDAGFDAGVTADAGTDAGVDSDAGVPRQGIFYDEQRLHGGVQRKVHLYYPTRTAGELRPVVVLLHGNGSSADSVLGRGGGAAPFKVWLDVAVRERLFLIIPDGLRGSGNEQGWNDCRGDATTNPTSDDVGFVNALLDELALQGADGKRTYATGLSNGGHFSLRLAIEQPQRFAAVAPVAALMPGMSECAAPTTPVSVYFVSGTSDPVCPYGGGPVGGSLLSGRGSVVSARASLDAWRTVNSVTQAEVDTPLTDLTSSDNCSPSRVTSGSAWPRVWQLRIDGGGHTEPSLTQRYSALYLLLVGRQNADVEMAEEVWSFFSTQARP